MSKKTKIIILVIVGIVIIAGIISYFAYPNLFQKGKVSETAPVKTVPADSGKPLTAPLPRPTEAEKTAAEAQAMVNAFVERFGTYTNESGYAGLIDLKSLMTASMADWLAKSYIPKLAKDHSPAGFFYGITAKAAAARILDQKATTMKVQVATMRAETIGTTEAQQFLQDILLDLVKTNGRWLVDGAYWQPRK
ncbi:MAG: hypothetical protein V1928_03515 [Parcubacteria group bacterium]